MKKIVVLTGAGMSVESGLKTFRDADEQHLADSADRAEVSVYLERRVRVEEILVCAAAVGVVHAGRSLESQLLIEELQCVVAVAQTRPEVYLPAEAPARAVVAAYFERAPASVRKLGRAVCCLCAWHWGDRLVWRCGALLPS